MRLLASKAIILTVATVVMVAEPIHSQDDTSTQQPNIVYIMADELAYFELGHMGNPYLKTPRIDKMAKDGIRFTNAYAASPVCAPLRGCLMTGKHSGHASVRANDGGTPLRAEEETIASVLKQKNYATGGFGKWGAGGRDSTGVPEKHGFDVFYGYYDQVHAHSFYPPYLIQNSEEVILPGNEGGRAGETYSHYKIMEEGLDFIREHKDEPFFAYFPITPPHGMYDIPADDPAWQQYNHDEWMKNPKISQEAKNYAAMVTMVDNNVGEILDLLKELDLEKNTIVFFTGDNGGEDRFKDKKHPRGLFGPNVNPETGVGFRGGKRQLYEGGLKIPFLVRWPGVIEGGRTSDLVFAQYDILATLADLTETKAPEDNDGISILPELLGDTDKQKSHEMLYWEFGNQTAVRYGKWKAIQPKKDKDWELYDLEKDISEENSVAKKHPDILKKMQEFAVASHTPVEPGTYTDPARTRHERDREAKWGTLRKDDKSKRTSNHVKAADLLPVDQMSLVRFSSENYVSDHRAEYAIDGKIHTLWQSDSKENSPQELVIDLGKERFVSAIHYLPRQDGSWKGSLGETEFYLGNSPDDFPEDPVAKTTFSKLRISQSLELPADTEKARYLLVRNLVSVDGDLAASAAEIRVSTGQGEPTPDGVDFLNPDSWVNGDSWATASEIEASVESKEWLSVTEGEGILYNQEKGKNLVSKIPHGDCRVVVEYMIPKKSNSGIYFQSRYEIQILDSFGKTDEEISVHDNGAIYERWNPDAEKGKQGYEGTPPSSNQSKAPGEWQTFEIDFRAPRFDKKGKKIENARFVSVIHNGVEIHSNVELTGPTRGGQDGPEVEKAPFHIQGDHGPVAFRQFEVTDTTSENLLAELEAQSAALKQVVTNRVYNTELEQGKKVQLRSMVMAAYRENENKPLWGAATNPSQIYQSLSQLLADHGFPVLETGLSFQLEEAEISELESPVPLMDLMTTLGLAEVCLRMKQGPQSESEWPNWTYGDDPIATSTSEHYNHVTERFGKMAAASSHPLDVAEDFVPKNWVYQRLYRALHQDLDETPEPPNLDVEGLIKVGNEFPQAMELAQFLSREGHLPPEELANIETVYSQPLSDALRAYQKDMSLQADGILGPATARRIATKDVLDMERIRTNLHRARRLPDDMGDRYLLANIPSGEVYGFVNGEETLRMRIVFGKSVLGQRTPLFRDKMERVVFRPYWNVPYSIATTESPYSNLGYLSSQGFKIISSNSGAALPLSAESLGRVRSRSAYIRQDGGSSNALGLVKFLFPNKHSVYMHDTPAKHYFNNSYRAQSHGCVRLQKPEEMANWLLGDSEDWNARKINDALYRGSRREVELEKDVPVFIAYFTAFPDPKKEGEIGLHRDYYSYDKPGAVVDAPGPRRPQVPIEVEEPKRRGLFQNFNRNRNRGNAPPWLERLRSRRSD